MYICTSIVFVAAWTYLSWFIIYLIVSFSVLTLFLLPVSSSTSSSPSLASSSSFFSLLYISQWGRRAWTKSEMYYYFYFYSTTMLWVHSQQRISSSMYYVYGIVHYPPKVTFLSGRRFFHSLLFYHASKYDPQLSLVAIYEYTRDTLSQDWLKIYQLSSSSLFLYEHNFLETITFFRFFWPAYK